MGSGKIGDENGEKGFDHGKAGFSKKGVGPRKQLRRQQSYGAPESADFQAQGRPIKAAICPNLGVPPGVRRLLGFTQPVSCSSGSKPSDSLRRKSRKSA